MYQPKMIIKIIEWNSSAYQAMIGLRKTVLLEPIGVPVTYIQPLNEKNDVFIAAFVNNEIVGCCVLTPGENNNIQLRQMAVATHLQGKGKLVSVTDTKKKYKAKDVTAANFFRFEGISNPDDMSVLYAIETIDGTKRYTG